MKRARGLRPLFASLGAMAAMLATDASAGAADGRELIEASLRRHAAPPALFEEQALILGDREDRLGVRTLRHYAQRDENGSRALWVIETPVEARGDAIYVGRAAADGKRHGAPPASPLFGSSFTLADLEEERTSDYRYERAPDLDLDRVPHHELRALPAAGANGTAYRERRLFLRKDNLFISRIDYKDRQGRVVRRQTFRDAQGDDAGAWRANMILIEDLREGRRSLLKIERRAYAADYVPAGIFDAWQARK